MTLYPVGTPAHAALVASDKATAAADRMAQEVRGARPELSDVVLDALLNVVGPACEKLRDTLNPGKVLGEPLVVTNRALSKIEETALAVVDGMPGSAARVAVLRAAAAPFAQTARLLTETRYSGMGWVMSKGEDYALIAVTGEQWDTGMMVITRQTSGVVYPVIAEYGEYGTRNGADINAVRATGELEADGFTLCADPTEVSLHSARSPAAHVAAFREVCRVPGWE